MKKHLFFVVSIACRFLIACQLQQPAGEPEPVLSKEQTLEKRLDSLQAVASPGDLIVRLGDDFLSYYIKYMNEKDYSYSHAGIIVEKDGQKMVVHITPDSVTSDRITYTPFDSFADINKTLQCAIYRYQIPDNEKEKALSIIDSFRRNYVRFDRLYELNTDDKLYCSEMISKAFTKATDSRLHFKTILVPTKMLPLLNKYFARDLKPEAIAKRTIMTIDNLYNIPECKPVMQITLKQLPGQ